MTSLLCEEEYDSEYEAPPFDPERSARVMESFRSMREEQRRRDEASAAAARRREEEVAQNAQAARDALENAEKQAREAREAARAREREARRSAAEANGGLGGPSGGDLEKELDALPLSRRALKSTRECANPDIGMGQHLIDSYREKRAKTHTTLDDVYTYMQETRRDRTE